MQSQEFRDTRTGEIVTQVPISEIQHFVEVEPKPTGYEFQDLQTVTIGDETYTLYEMHNLKTDKKFYRIGLEPDPNQDGCDVEVMPQTHAVEFIEKVFNLHVEADEYFKHKEYMYSIQGKHLKRCPVEGGPQPDTIVDEITELDLITIIGKLLNIHITDDRGVCRV